MIIIALLLDQPKPDEALHQLMLHIRDREFQLNDRSVSRRWDGDLTIASNSRYVFRTLVKCKTSYVKLRYLPDRDT